jgi:hypothetical protein
LAGALAAALFLVAKFSRAVKLVRLENIHILS